MNIDDIKIEKEPVIVFMGTPDFAVPILEGLIENYKVRMVVTQPDKPVGRNQILKQTPIKEVANEHNILCLQPTKISDILGDISSIKPDIIITCAYGQILPVEMLAIPRLGCINVHASLLPKLRGGAPIHRAIMEGFEETGITIMYMAEGMDNGDIISQEAIKILPEDTTSLLHDKLSILGKELLLKTLPSILNGTNKRYPQNEEEATYGFVIKKEDEKIMFGNTAREIINQIRGLSLYPGAYCFFDDKRLKIYEAYRIDNTHQNAIPGEITAIYKDGFGVKVLNGEIVVTEVGLEGKSKTDSVSFINGHKDLVGKVLK